MQCKCGGEICLFVHEVKSYEKKAQWLRIAKHELNVENPLRIEANRCINCGRQLVKVFDSYTNELIMER